MNSAALRFIPVDKLESEGYGQYLAQFKAAGVATPKTTANTQPMAPASATQTRTRPVRDPVRRGTAAPAPT